MEPGQFQIEFASNSLWAHVTGSFKGLKQDLDDLDCPTYSLNNDGSMRVLVGALASVIDPSLMKPMINTHDIGKRSRKLRELLRPYQVEAVCAAISAPWLRGILNLTMGAGKTNVSAGIATLGSTYGFKEWLYLVHNKELAAQSMKVFQKVVPKMLESLEVNEKDRQTFRLEAASYSQLDELDTYWDGIIDDECHALVPRSRSIPYARLKAHYRIGLSGTALDRQDGRNAMTVGLLGPVLYSKDVEELEEEGFLSRGSVRKLMYQGGCLVPG